MRTCPFLLEGMSLVQVVAREMKMETRNSLIGEEETSKSIAGAPSISK
jgi:hypothetical protein